MPIYEYYCKQCNGRFSHLARSFNAPPPPCPRCGNTNVRRLVSAASMLRTHAQHTEQLAEDKQRVDINNDQEIATFLKKSGRLDDAGGVYGSKAYRELIERRAAGATDEQVTDLVDDLVASMRDNDATRMAGAVMFSDRVENRMLAEGPPDDHDHPELETTTAKPNSCHNAQNLGWAKS